MMDQGLLDWLASCNKDPLRFVMGAFPWQVPGTSLEKFTGPEDWQRGILEDVRVGLLTPNEAIQLAVASGHGIGKSSLVSWIILWAFCTAADTRGVVTANTETQLKTKTWAELGKWFNLCFFARVNFNLTATALFSKDPDHALTWRIDMVPWSEKNTEAFAGLHNKGKRLILIMDEASAIPDVIHETAEGALTDSETEILWLMCGNPTRNSGRFKEAFAGGKFHRFWKCRQIDSRTVSITNKKRIADWIEAYGEDSDFVRIRVLGIFPRHGMMEFFSAADIDAAMARDVIIDRDTPLAIGVDVARFGSNNSVIWPRKGRDARSYKREIYNGIDTVQLATKVFEANERLRADGLMVDEGGVGGGVVDNLRAMRLHVFGVQFGGKDVIYNTTQGNTGEKYANNRAAIYGMGRAWMKSGALPNDPEIRRQLLAVKYTFNKKDEIQLESKEDMMADNDGLSPDDVDALMVTFAYPISKSNQSLWPGQEGKPPQAEYEYDPYSEQRMSA